MSNIKAIIGYKGYYASKNGEIFTKWSRRWRNAGYKTKDGAEVFIGNKLRKLAGSVDTSGYRKYCLGNNGKKTTATGSVLVLLAFEGARPDGMLACHNNGDKLDNRISNLRWDTPKSNTADIKKHGNQNFCIGERVGTSKLNEKQVRVIRHAIGYGSSDCGIAKLFGVCRETIRKIRLGITWSHSLAYFD